MGENLFSFEHELLEMKQVGLYVIDIDSWRKLLKVPCHKQMPLIVRQHSHSQTSSTKSGEVNLDNKRTSCDSQQTILSSQACKRMRFDDGEDNHTVSANINVDVCSSKSLELGLVSAVKDIVAERDTFSGDVNEDSVSEFSEDSLTLNDENSMDDIKTSSYNKFLHSPEWLTLLSMLSKKPYALDIDLDFFSTMDPFKSQFTAEQYSLLKKLYEFQPATDDSDEVRLNS